MRKIETVNEHVVYQNKFVTVFDDDVRFPDGSTGTYFRTRWNAPFGVAIVPVIGEAVLLVRLFRYSARTWSLEIPQGFGTDGSEPIDDACRELREETGLRAEKIEPLLDLGHDYVTHGFLAEIECSASPHLEHLERSEAVQSFELMPIANITMPSIVSAGIREPNTIACLLSAREVLSQ